MAILNIQKEPWERITIGGDFSNVLAAGETIVAPPVSTVTAFESTGTNVSEIFLDQATISVDGSILKIRCLDGYSGKIYFVNFKIETSLGERWETNIKIVVKTIGA